MRKNEVTKLQAVIENNTDTALITKAKQDINWLSKHNPKQIKDKKRIKLSRLR